MAELKVEISRLQRDLETQGLKLFPHPRVGARAHALWCKIREHLSRGHAISITSSRLGLRWHREQLRRARITLVGMRLVKPRADGLYVIDQHDPHEELMRDRFLELKLLEEVYLALSGLVSKSKTRTGEPGS